LLTCTIYLFSVYFYGQINQLVYTIPSNKLHHHSVIKKTRRPVQPLGGAAIPVIRAVNRQRYSGVFVKGCLWRTFWHCSKCMLGTVWCEGLPRTVGAATPVA